MNKRLLSFVLVALATQLFSSGCHPIARWRANHPCTPCAPSFSSPALHSRLHPIQTRHAIVGQSYGAPVGPTVGVPCHGCGATSGIPVGHAGITGELMPVTHPGTAYPPISGYPSIGSPMPLTPGPMVIPSYELPNPMPLPKNTGTEK